jgi:proteic killer suppression protein
MIENFGDRTTQDIYDGINSRFSRKIPLKLHAKAQRLHDQINAAQSLELLRTPPGNRLEKLSGDLKGLWSLPINEQWRIVFRWTHNHFYDVRIIDYHRR